MKKNFTLFLSLLMLLSFFSFSEKVFASEPGGVEFGDNSAESELFLEANDDYSLDLDSEPAISTSTELSVNAPSCALMEAQTGTLLYESNSNEKRSPASVTKIMTLLLVMEALDSGKINMQDVVVTTEAAAEKGGSQIWLEVGEEMTVHDLLKATAIGSANDASVALAEHVAGSEEAFVKLMNDRASALGMANTCFENCTGLDDTTTDHYTTAYDIALMSCELLKHEAVLEFTTTWMDSLRGGETQLVNTNKLVRFYEGITGLKTGTTEKAGSCLSASAKREEMKLVAVVLGAATSADRFDGARNLLNWGFANYTVVKPEPDLNMITPIKVSYGVFDSVTPVAGDIPFVLIRKGTEEELVLKYRFNELVEAPLEKGSVLGRIDITHGEANLGSIQLVSPSDIGRMTFLTALSRLISHVFKNNT